MSSVGKVLSAEIPTNAAGKSKGYATVKYESNEAAAQAVAIINGTELEGRAITVRPFRPAAPPASKAPKAAPSSGNVYIGNVAFSGWFICQTRLWKARSSCPPPPSLYYVHVDLLVVHGVLVVGCVFFLLV